MKKYWVHIFITVIFIGTSLTGLSNFDSLLIGKQEALDSADQLNSRGLEYKKAGDLDKFEECLKKALSLNLHFLEKDDIANASIYNNFGILYKRHGKYDKALSYYSKSEKICINHYGIEFKYLAHIYFNKANIYNSQGDFEKALSYYKKSLAILEKKRLENITDLSILYNSLGNLYQNICLFEKANDYYLKSVIICEFYNNRLLPQVYGNMANNYNKYNNFEKANEYYHLSIESAKKIFNSTHYRLANKYLNYGLFCFGQGENNKALELYQKAYEIYLINFNEKHPKVARSLYRIGGVYLNQNKIVLALDYFQKSLIALSKNFDNQNIYSNPDYEDAFSQIYLLETLKKKATTLYKSYNTSKNIESLEASLNTNNLAIKLIEKLRTDYQSQESKLFLSENQTETYHMAIRTALKLHRITKDTNYQNLVFKYAEKNKAAILRTSLQNIEAKSIANIPDSLQLKEENNSREIHVYKQLCYKENLNSNFDSAKVSLWESNIFDLYQEKEKLLELFETEYPSYHKLKYNTSVPEVFEVQKKLKKNQILVEYTLADTFLVAMIITPDKYRLITSDIDSTFHRNCQTFINCMKNYSLEGNYNQQYDEYTSSANYLWNKLIAPLQIPKGKSLTIVPDNILSFIPFEALLCNMPSKSNKQYHNLEYLLYQHPISYMYFAAILFHPYKGKPEIEMGAFAPGYAKRKNLMPLDNREEIKILGKSFQSEIYLDSLATKKSFLQNASKYETLVLNMHGLMIQLMK